jgi:hypothetical protein
MDCEQLAGVVGDRTSLLSCVSRTATPASTLPTVNEISILICDVVTFFVVARDSLRLLADAQVRKFKVSLLLGMIG